MSAKAADSATATAAPPPKGRMKLVLGIVVAVLLAGGAAAGGTWFFLNKTGAAAPAAAADAEPEPDAKHADATYLALENLIVNLADPGGERVAQIGMTLDVRDEKTAARLKTLMPVVRSRMLMLVSQRTSEELLKRDGKEKLADDVMIEVTRVLNPDAARAGDDEAPRARKPRANGPVRGVLFSSFIVQ
ncbi:flagellar basal body-associated protein FliL [Variovorax sp.]|uniref:flagellar basal body-associated protein FliL n=1 Tax=Variovorax sp. TaxID=1871043 RepID=UPI0037D995A4